MLLVSGELIPDSELIDSSLFSLSLHSLSLFVELIELNELIEFLSYPLKLITKII